MARNRREGRKRALGRVQPGQVILLEPKQRRSKKKPVGFAATFVVGAPWSIIVDSRLLTRLVQIRLGEHFTASLEAQIDPNTGQPLPVPRKTRKKRNGKLGIQSGRMLRSWQIAKITGKLSRSRGRVTPFADGATGNPQYSRRFFLEYMLGKRTYTVTDPKYQKRDARGRFERGGARKGPGPRYPHAPVDFQHVAGKAATVIEDALNEYIQDSGLRTSSPLLPPPKYLGGGNLPRVRDASGF